MGESLSIFQGLLGSSGTIALLNVFLNFASSKALMLPRLLRDAY